MARYARIALFCFFFLYGMTLFPQTPLTTAEDDNFTSTARHTDVWQFIRELQRRTPLLRVEKLCITAERLYQGHRMNTVKGEFTVEKKEFPAGTHFIATAQPLGNLAAYLLEPESDDGLLVWNYLDKFVVSQWGMGFESYPVYKLLKPVNLAKETVTE